MKHHFKNFRSRTMREEQNILHIDEYPLIYNGVKMAEKAALKYGGELLRVGSSMNKYYIIKKVLDNN